MGPLFSMEETMPHARYSIFPLLLLAASVLVTSNAEAQYRRNNDGYGRRSSANCVFGPAMMNALEMTDAQRAKVNKLYYAALEDVDDLDDEIDREERRLDALYESSRPDQKKIDAVQRRIDALDRQVDARWKRFRDDVLDLLTDAQIDQYNRYRSRGYGPGVDTAPGWGRGRGRGYGRGRGWDRGRNCGRGRGLGPCYRNW